MRQVISKSVKLFLFIIFFQLATANAQKSFSKNQIQKLKKQTVNLVQSKHKMTQVMIDKVFSFAELGHQEYETSKYLSSILESSGFEIEYGISGIPTAWMAKWSNGKGPVIALGSDVDGIPKASQYPGVAYHKPMVEGAPGHGEGHNSGLPVIITSALVVQKQMKENNLGGTLVIWPGIAEEQLAAKAWYVKDGYFNDVTCVFLLM